MLNRNKLLSLLFVLLFASCKAETTNNRSPATTSGDEITDNGWTSPEFESAEDPEETIMIASESEDLSLLYPGELKIPDTIGTQHANDLTIKDINMIGDLGLKYIRIVMHVTMDMWNIYDPLVEAMWARDITPVVTIVSSELMDDPAIQAKYIEGAKRTAARYARGLILWDVYNEPTSPAFWKSQATPSGFANYAFNMIDAIKSGAPQHQVILPSIQRTDSVGEKFLWGVFAARPELLTKANYVSIHTYGPQSGAGPYHPEYKASEIVTLRSKFWSQFKTSPSWVVSEFGWHTVGGGSVSQANQGIYVPRLILINMQIGIPLTIYYAWRDAPSEVGKSEPGLLSIDFKPRTGYMAMKSLIDNLRGYSLVRSLTTGTTHAQLWRAPGLPDKIAAWIEAGNPRNVTLVAPNKKKMALQKVSQAPKYFVVPASISF